MGILARFTDIIDANINALLDKAENPEKMIDQYLRKMSNDLEKVKQETASVMAEESRTKRLVDENEKEVRKYTELAKKALIARNEDDARAFLTKKQTVENRGAELKLTYAVANENSLKMKQLYNKLVKDINELNTKRQAIKTKVKVAKTTDTVTKLATSSSKIDNARGAFERMGEKADRMLDEANARAELDASPIDPIQALELKYNFDNFDESVTDELNELKRKLGINSITSPSIDEIQALEMKYKVDSSDDSIGNELEILKSQLESD